MTITCSRACVFSLDVIIALMCDFVSQVIKPTILNLFTHLKKYKGCAQNCRLLVDGDNSPLCPRCDVTKKFWSSARKQSYPPETLLWVGRLDDQLVFRQSIVFQLLSYQHHLLYCLLHFYTRILKPHSQFISSSYLGATN